MTKPTALVVGGTGPTGPYIVNGLRERGYAVSIFHRGTHEIDEIPADVEHIHGDPHFTETINDAIAGRTFDVVIATYGRIRLLAESLQGKTGRFLSVGGVASYRGYLDPESLMPMGMPMPIDEQAPLVASEQEHRFSFLIAETERAVLAHHPDASHFRYPYVYGPRQLIPREWSIVRRVLDGRSTVIVPDGGLNLLTRGYAENLAHAVLLAIDHPEPAAGQIYNCGDETQYTLRQIVELICDKMNHDVEIINIPHELALPAHAYAGETKPFHRIMDITKIKTELGYRDLHNPVEALGLTVDWLLDNQPTRGGDVEEKLQDSFNYKNEDALVAAWREAADTIKALPIEAPSDRPHPYAHPKKPGERDHRNR